MVKLSASRIDTLNKCSWLYYVKYVLKLPDSSNDGAKRGTVSHNILELLLKKKHKKHYDFILKNQSVEFCEPVRRLIWKQTKKLDICDEDNLQLIYSFLWVGLNWDFFCEGSLKLLSPEKAFDIKNDDPNYSILGFIDKVAFYDDYILITDYKTSKQKYKGKEVTFNTQALIYSIAALHLWPEYKKVKVKFLFLKFPKAPEINCEFSEEQLKGAEKYLEGLSEYLQDYTLEKAQSSFAYSKGYPKDNTFGGPLVCGGKKAN